MLAASQAEASWNNAFQVCCNCRHSNSNYAPPAVAYSPAPAASEGCCPPPPCCSTSYVQRCYYQPVVSYKTECVPVTSYKTSYYWEPVCSYRSSCYYDPCTGSSIQVTQPVTSYRLRSQCNAVTSYVQRCVPVTSYRQAYYWEAVNNCGGTAAPPAATETAPPAVADPNRIQPPNVPMSPPAAQEGNPQGAYYPYVPNRQIPINPNPMPAATPTQPKPIPIAPARIEHVVSRTTVGQGTTVQGQVVANNFVTPLQGAKLMFVSRQSGGPQQAATADMAGRFNVALPQGEWNIYVSRNDGSLEYHSSIDVRNEARNVVVVSR
jgi:hypothetical protein